MKSTRVDQLFFRICSFLLSLLLLLSICPDCVMATDVNVTISVNAHFVNSDAENLGSIQPQLHLYSNNTILPPQQIDEVGVMSNYKYNIEPGDYLYEVYAVIESENYVLGSGTLTIDEQHSDIVLMCVNVATILYSSDREKFDVRLIHQDGRILGASKGGYYYYVPAFGGDSYYSIEFVPKDIEHYITQTAHFYVYPSERIGTFFSQNLSDQHVFSLIERKDFIVKAPKDVEVYYVDQIRFYMARDFIPLEKERVDEEYAYYKADHLGTLMLRQEGKVTRYCELSGSDASQIDVGTWSEDCADPPGVDE